MSTSTLISPHAGLVAELRRKAGKFLTVLFLILVTSLLVQAQDPAPTPVANPSPSAREMRLAEENRMLEQEKKNAELRKAIRDAQPQPSSSPLEGKTTIDENVIIETQMVTYKAMSDVADRIGEEIHQKFAGARAIAIYDADELQNLKHYRATSPVLEGRIEALKEQYQRLLSKFAAIRPRVTSKAASSQAKVMTSSNLSSVMADVNTVTAASSSILSSSASATSSSLSSAIVPGVAGVGTGLKAFADLLALMRSDTEIKGKSVTVEERAMVAETFRALRNRFDQQQLKLYYPQVVPPEIYLEGCQYNQKPAYCSPTLSALASLYARKEEAENNLLAEMFDVSFQVDKATAQKSQAEAEIKELAKQIGDLKLDRLKAELETPWTPGQVSRFDKYVQELEARKSAALSSKAEAESDLEYFGKKKNVLEQLQGLNRQADELVANLAKPDEKSGKSELANFLRAENIDKAIGKDGYWLEFKSVSAGGNNRTRKNLFRYFSGAKLDHSGGVIVEWALYDPKGVSVASNKDSSYGGYQTPKEIQSAKFQDAVADPPATQAPAIAKSGKQ